MARPSLASRIGDFAESYRGWLMVYLAFVLLLVGTGPLFNYSLLLVSLQEEFRSGAALTGWVGSIANTLLFINPLSPPLIRRFGPRSIGLLGACLLSGGLVATSFVPGLVYALLTYGVAAGMGGCFLFHSAMVVVYDWFPDKHCSRATAGALMGTSMGVLVFAPLLRTLLTVYGWRNTLRIVGGGCFAVSVVHGAFIGTRAKVDSGVTEDVEENNNADTQDATSRVGPALKADEASGVDTAELESQFHESRRADVACVVDSADPQVDAASQIDTKLPVDAACQPTPVNFCQRLIQALLLVDTWLWLMGSCVTSVAWVFIVVNYAGFLENDVLFTADQIALAFLLLGIGEVLGKGLLSAFGDYVSRLYSFAGSNVLAAVVCGLMVVFRTVPLLYAVSFLLGPIKGVSYAAPFSASMDICGDFGSDIVLFAACVPIGLGTFVGAPLTGGLNDLTGDYTLTILIMASLFLLSSFLVLMIPARKRLRKLCRSRAAETRNIVAGDDPSTPQTISVNIALEM